MKERKAAYPYFVMAIMLRIYLRNIFQTPLIGSISVTHLIKCKHILLSRTIINRY